MRKVVKCLRKKREKNQPLSGYRKPSQGRFIKIMLSALKTLFDGIKEKKKKKKIII